MSGDNKATKMETEEEEGFEVLQHPLACSPSDVIPDTNQGFELGAVALEGDETKLILCQLCLSDYTLDMMYSLKNCSCLYCIECMKQYLTVMINEGCVLNLTCPDARCQSQGLIKTSEIEELVEKNVFKRYLRLKFQQEVELDPNRTYCPEVGCETICHVCSSGSSDSAIPAKPVNCPTCGLQFCSVCKSKWHIDVSCDEALQASGNNGGIPYAPVADGEIKRCPLCYVPIERNDGCAQMMCRRCKHVFCWYCLTSLDDDFLLRHYDKGPCKNKLGHSRASLIWHRTQVVGIFAGIGLLLLVASPFLLLAAPCILCLKIDHNASKGDKFQNLNL